MSTEKDKDKDKDSLRRTAYMDQELSVDEVIAYEESLSRIERIELQEDMHFDAALAERLEQSRGCPDALWGRLKCQIEAQSSARLEKAQRPDAPAPTAPTTTPATGGGRGHILRLALSYAAVAVLAALTAAVVLRSPTSSGDTVLVFSDNLEAFAMDKSVAGDFSKVNRELVIHGYNVKLNEPHLDDGHGIELLGMRMHDVGGRQVAQLYFACCGKPITVLLTNREDAAALKRFDYKGLPGRWNEAHNTVDDYVIHVVGSHELGDVADLFS